MLVNHQPVQVWLLVSNRKWLSHLMLPNTMYVFIVLASLPHLLITFEEPAAEAS